MSQMASGKEELITIPANSFNNSTNLDSFLSTKARLKAEAKYHEVLAAAAVSELPQHSATLLTSDGRAIMNQCYRHEIAQPEPEVTPEEG